MHFKRWPPEQTPPMTRCGPDGAPPGNGGVLSAVSDPEHDESPKTAQTV